MDTKVYWVTCNRKKLDTVLIVYYTLNDNIIGFGV